MKLRYYLFQISEKLEIILYLVFFALVLFGCSPESRLNRLVKNNPELRQRDTITLTDTVLVPGSKWESVFVPGKDTVVIREGRLEQRFFYNDTTHTVYLYGECKPDTLVLVREVPVDRFTQKEERWNLWQLATLLLVGIIAGLFIFRL